MSYVACTSHGPTFEFPIVEQNAERSLRPVIIKYRKVLGKRGWMLRRIGHYLGAPRTPEGMAHAALMVGDYVHELHTDEANQKYLVAQRLTGDQIWPSTVGEVIKGYTTMTDQEVSDHASRAQSWMRSRHRGKYSVKHNNCHHFVNELLRQVSLGPDQLLVLDDDQSSCSTQWAGSTTTLEVGAGLDEKLDPVTVSVVQPVLESFSEKQHEIMIAAGRL
ncbi:hypothetical protein Q7P35_011126 [Cladosporium inversicolor]